MVVHYYPLINKIINGLNIRDRLNIPYAANIEDSFIIPFITVARDPGSGGAPIAKAVAEKLGFTFVDEQIVDEIAHSTKKRTEIIKAVDEKSRSKIKDIIHSMFNSEYVDDVKYVTELARVILTYALKGRVVILGRGANFITPYGKGLHVNITAPYETRVQRAMDYEGLNKEQAKEVIAKVQKERDDFVKQYFLSNSKRATAYDLTINTEYYKVNEARDIILEAFYRKFSRSVRYGAIFKKLTNG
jgi:cytidylate kinase